MISRILHKGISWVDLHNPTSEDVISVTKEFKLHPAVTEELIKPSFHPRAENYGLHLYLILYLPIFDESRRSLRSRELDIIIGRNFFITVHYDAISPLAEFFGQCDVNLSLRERYFEGTSEKLFFYTWCRLYEFLLLELDQLQKKVDMIEERIFENHERELIKDISLLRRDVLDFLRSLRTHETVLDSLLVIGKEFFGQGFLHFVKELQSRWRRVMGLIENHKDTLETLYDTHSSLLTHRSNRVIKTFTMLALFTFPLTLIATVFGLDAVANPVIGHPFDFWIIVGILVAVFLTMFSIFKYRGWI
jgi:magnesium transporter